MELHNILALNSLDDLMLIRPDLCTQQGINNIYRNIVHVLIQSGECLLFPSKILCVHVRNTGGTKHCVILKENQ